jgi:hypothetical protein
MFTAPLNITVERFQFIVMRKAQGKTWQEIAQETSFTVLELEALRWQHPQEWDTDFARASLLHHQDLFTPCVNKLQAALLPANEPRDLGTLARAFHLFWKAHPMRSAERGTRNEKAKTPEYDDSDEADSDEVEDEVIKTPEQKRVEEIAELLEKEEERIFNEELQKAFGDKPEILQKVQEAARKHADRAPVPEAVDPTECVESIKPIEPLEPLTTPTSTNTSTVKHVASWAALLVVLFFACRGLAREARTKYGVPPSRLGHEHTTQITSPKHIWPLSGDD